MQLNKIRGGGMAFLEKENMRSGNKSRQKPERGAGKSRGHRLRSGTPRSSCES